MKSKEQTIAHLKLQVLIKTKNKSYLQILIEKAAILFNNIILEKHLNSKMLLKALNSNYRKMRFKNHQRTNMMIAK